MRSAGDGGDVGRSGLEVVLGGVDVGVDGVELGGGTAVLVLGGAEHFPVGSPVSAAISGVDCVLGADPGEGPLVGLCRRDGEAGIVGLGDVDAEGVQGRVVDGVDAGGAPVVLEAVERGDEGRGLASVAAGVGVNVNVDGVISVLLPARLAWPGDAGHGGVISGPVDLPVVLRGEEFEVVATEDRVPDIDAEAVLGSGIDGVDADELPVATITRDGRNVGGGDVELASGGVHVEVEARTAGV